MKRGDVLPVKGLRAVIQDGKGWMDFKAPRGELFVVLLLGTEAPAGPRLDPEAVLKSLGWTSEASLTTARADGIEEALRVLNGLTGYTGEGTEDRNDSFAMFARGVRYAKRTVTRALSPPANEPAKDETEDKP